MSYDTYNYWIYKVVGRNIHLYEYVDSTEVDTLGSYKIRLPQSYYGSGLVYPSESITNGLRFEGTAFIEPFVGVDPNELDGSDNPTLTGETATEASHVNMSRMLCLAIVDYLKAMLFDRAGDIEHKEYYMREFWKKVGDNESNKRKISMAIPVNTYAVK